MAYYYPVPDNDNAFFAYVNLVINNKSNSYKDDPTRRPYKIGPYSVSYTHNECGELYMVVDNLKMQKFIEMIVDQFCLLRTYWSTIENEIDYNSSDKYSK